jgi:hypothetical protein
MYIVERSHDLLDKAAALLLREAVLTIRYLGKQLTSLHKKQILKYHRKTSRKNII